MIAININLCIDQGTDFSQQFILKDPDTDQPLDLTGYTATSSVKQFYDSTDPLWSFTCVIEALTGTITISNTPTDTNDAGLTLPSGICDVPWVLVWDLFINSSDDVLTRIVKGNVDLFPKVT